MKQRCLKKSPVVFCALFCFCTFNYGQEKVVNTSDQEWIHSYATFGLSESLNLQADGGYRWKNGLVNRSQYIIRLGGSYELGKWFQLAGGIAYSGTYVDGSLGRVEFRPYQDIALKININKVNILQRFRLEERFINPVFNGRIQNSNSFNMRYRYAIVLYIPLFRPFKNLPDSQFILNVGDEIFINGGDNINYLFDQNRFSVCPTVKWNKNFSVGLNWTHSYATTSMLDTILRTDIIWLQIRQRFMLYHKKGSE